MHPRDDPATSVSFYGFIKDHLDALLLITAARFGLIPRFRRRLNMAEQDSLIFSGSVFLWTEEESCMKRWTDGYPWSPSRIHHEFLLYREMAERGCARSRTSSRLAANDASDESLRSYDDRRRKTIRVLAGSLFNRKELDHLVRLSTSGEARPDDIFKRGGLMKKTFSLSLPGETWHVVSYYTLEDALGSRLLTPKESSSLEGLSISDEVQSCHTLSVRRQSLGTSVQNFTEPSSFSPLCDASSQEPQGTCDLPPEVLAEVSEATTDTDEWLNMLNLSVGNPIPYRLSPPPVTYTTPSVTYTTPPIIHTTPTPHSVGDPRQPRADDTTAGWYAFT